MPGEPLASFKIIMRIIFALLFRSNAIETGVNWTLKSKNVKTIIANEEDAIKVRTKQHKYRERERERESWS